MTTLSSINIELEKMIGKLPLYNKESDLVPGEGNQEAEIFFIGEAPGETESIKRRPFVGRSGQLFRRTLADNGIDPKKTYITNIVKIRPPDNRDPTPEEINSFRPFLDAEIKSINPRLIVTLGRYSMAKFLPMAKISKIHGRLHLVNWMNKQRYIFPLYHPAAALRGTKVKELFVEDIKKIPKIIEWIKDKNASSNDQILEF